MLGWPWAAAGAAAAVAANAPTANDASARGRRLEVMTCVGRREDVLGQHLPIIRVVHLTRWDRWVPRADAAVPVLPGSLRVRAFDIMRIAHDS